MSLKDLILFLDTRWPNDVQLALAAVHGAAVAAVACCPEPDLTLAECYAASSEAVAEVMQHRDAQVAVSLSALQEDFRRVAGAKARWIGGPVDQTPGRLALFTRCHDLAVVGRAPGAITLAEEIVRLGEACMIGAETMPSTGIGRILVAWDGSRPAERAVRAALPLLEKASGVRIVTVGDINPDLDRPDAEDLTRHLALHGIVADVHAVPASTRRVPVELLDQAAAFAADLVVIGAYSRPRTLESLFGGVTHTVLGESRIPVLVAH